MQNQPNEPDRRARCLAHNCPEKGITVRESSIIFGAGTANGDPDTTLVQLTLCERHERIVRERLDALKRAAELGKTLIHVGGLDGLDAEADR
jgi:hypothetical protein